MIHTIIFEGRNGRAVRPSRIRPSMPFSLTQFVHFKVIPLSSWLCRGADGAVFVLPRTSVAQMPYLENR